MNDNINKHFSVSFECSGKKFADKSLLKDAGVGMTELQYIFVSFGTITEDDNIKKHKEW